MKRFLAILFFVFAAIAAHGQYEVVIESDGTINSREFNVYDRVAQTWRSGYYFIKTDSYTMGICEIDGEDYGFIAFPPSKVVPDTPPTSIIISKRDYVNWLATIGYTAQLFIKRPQDGYTFYQSDDRSYQNQYRMLAWSNAGSYGLRIDVDSGGSMILSDTSIPHVSDFIAHFTEMGWFLYKYYIH